MPGNFVRCGIYFLVDKDEIVYVGQSRVAPERRIADARRKGLRFDSYFVLLCEWDELNELETQYIVEFDPKYNGVTPAANEAQAWGRAPGHTSTRALGRLLYRKYQYICPSESWVYGKCRELMEHYKIPTASENFVHEKQLISIFKDFIAVYEATGDDSVVDVYSKPCVVGANQE